MLLGLLLGALICLVVGILFASSAWLIGSLAASLVATLVLYRKRSQVIASPSAVSNRPEAAAAAGGAPVARAVVTGRAFAGADRPPAMSVPRSGAKVWVVDGRPAYHLGQCAEFADLPAGVAPERVPLRQAIEDGFVACPTCNPTEHRLAAGTNAPADPAVSTASRRGGIDKTTPAPGEVWVVDGRPRYHRSGCVGLDGQPAEAVPRAQAVEDGFIPCSLCEPDGAAA